MTKIERLILENQRMILALSDKTNLILENQIIKINEVLNQNECSICEYYEEDECYMSNSQYYKRKVSNDFCCSKFERI